MSGGNGVVGGAGSVLMGNIYHAEVVVGFLRCMSSTAWADKEEFGSKCIHVFRRIQI